MVFTPEDQSDTILPYYRQWTNDVFVLPIFLQPSHYATFLVYLVRSRHVHVVFLTGSEEAYLLLPYLRDHTERFDPSIIFVDYTHSATPDWKQGGYARYSIVNQRHLDRSLFCAEAVRAWAVQHGHSADKTAAVYVGTEITQRKKHFGLPPRQLSLAESTLRSRTRQAYHLAESTVVILYIARIEPQKLPFVFGQVMVDLHMRLRAMAEQSQQQHNQSTTVDFHAFVVGDGESLPQLKDFLRASTCCYRARHLPGYGDGSAADARAHVSRRRGVLAVG